MYKIFSLLTFASFVFINGYAQKNLQPGYILNNNNDTIYGFIDYKEWFKNPDNILFAQSKDAGLQKLAIRDINGFSITGKELYHRYTVHISMNRDVVNASTTKDTNSSIAPVLLKMLYAGKFVQLFSYKDEIKTRLYVLSVGDTVPVELKNTEYVADGQVKSDKEYQGVLLMLAKKYATGNTTLQLKIPATGFYKDDILKVLHQINGATSANKPEAGIDKDKPRIIRFFAGTGLNMAHIKITGNNRYAGKTGNSSITPLIGAGFEIFLNPYIGKLFLRTDISYSTAKTTADTYEEFFASKEYYNLSIKQNTLSIYQLINYNLYNGKEFKYFIGAGAGFNFSSYPQNVQTFRRESSNDTTIDINNNYFAFIKKFWMNGIVRTGISIKNINVALAYTTLANFTNYAGYGANISSFRLQVNYEF